MNSTANGSSESSSCFTQLNSTAWKIGATVTYCLFIIVSLAANSLIVMIVYKTPNLRKPINYFIANMASSDLLFPMSWIPRNLSHLHTNSFLIGGQLGQALCKLIPFFGHVSFVVSIQNLILIAVDRFGAVVFPLRSPLIRSKLCPFFILSTWIVAVAVNSPRLFTFELVEYPEGTRCGLELKKAFGELSSFASYQLASYILFIFIPVLSLVILYSIIVIKLETQVHPGEQSANSQQQRNKRNRNVLQMSIAIVTVYLTACVQFRRYVAKLSMNSTANGSRGSWSCFTQLNSTAWKIGATVTYCLFIIVSLAANSLIVMIVYKTPNLRKPINYFIANMASSDLLVPIFFIPWRLSYLHTNSFLIGGKLGQALCKLLPFLAEVSILVSIQNLILIAVDRFGAVVFPPRSPLIRSKLCPFFILSTWIVAVAFNSPDLLTYELFEYPEGTRCVLDWKKAFGELSSFVSYQLASCILFLFIPVLSLVILYFTIVIRLKTKAHPGEQSANSQQQRNKRNRNVLQMSIGIVTVFVLCWLPFSINYFIRRYQDPSTHFSCSFWIYYEVTFYMTCAYCAVNPIICFMFSSNYRKALKRLIKCSFVQA
ncbi:unnamed protein product [Porites evermanni]|uniref:G-protein coupled receptors family 1 profile domain-containing protein n=1 Tax=Porites evermanni TaxID=104178 RepID=A0ABN8MJS8_9CNID|nr:unnamed protein product [Porites evermanni]